MSGKGRTRIEDWKLDRCLELGRKQNVTVTQIAERLGMEPNTVRRYLKTNGITPYQDKPFPWTKWLADQYRKDKEAGKKTGKRPLPSHY